MLLVWRMRQDIRMYEHRVLVQAVLATAPADTDEKTWKTVQEAWKDYDEELFPFQRGKRRTEDKAAIDYLKREVGRGPLTVTPLQPLTSKGRSRLKRRHEAVKDERMKLRLPRRRRR